MKIIRNKFVIGLLCIAIGITVGFVLLPKSQENEAAMAQAVRVQTDIEAGTRLEEAMLETVSVPAASLPSGAHAALESFLGRYAATSLFAGDILTEAKVRDTLADPVAAGAAKGKQLVSVTMPSLSAGVSGLLRPGDVVSVMVTSKVTQFNQQLGLLAATEQTDTAPEGGDMAGGSGEALLSSVHRQSQTVIPDELRYLEVCKVTSSDGTDALVNAAKDPEQPNRLPATVTFYATEEQALKLAEVEQNGELHIVFLARGDDADVYIPREQRVLAEEAPTTPAPTPVPETSTPTAQPATPTATGSAATGAPTQSAAPATATPGAMATSTAQIDINDPEVGE